MEELEREEHHRQNTLVHTVTTEHHATTMATIYWNSVQRMISLSQTPFLSTELVRSTPGINGVISTSHLKLTLHW